jgi:hypothetical protein
MEEPASAQQGQLVAQENITAQTNIPQKELH